MNTTKRDLVDYVEQYRTLPFESVQTGYRRNVVLREISRHSPRRLLEVGCGELPLLTDLPQDISVTVVEPAQTFIDQALKFAAGRDHVKVIHGFIESADLPAANFDMVVLSCVLHEVPDPVAMLKAVRRLCAPNAILHVNVPNSRSLHRLLAVAMGLIPSFDSQSDTQRRMQQRQNPYDASTLVAELSSSGFEVVEQGTLFVKPFSHSQMKALVDSGFMSRAMLDGLDKLVELLPELGSEIWINARKTL